MSDPSTPEAAASLAAAIAERTARVGVVGLGYIGLPLGLAFAEAGFSVLGFDIDPVKPEQLARGECYIRHLDPEPLERALAAGRFAATADFERLGEPDVVILCVPTPLTPQREPDTRHVEATVAELVPRLRRGQLVILESTTWPGTTEELVAPPLAATGLVPGEDVFVAYSPEREDPGNRDWGTARIPKVIGGLDPVSGDLAEALYGAVVAETVRVSSARAAEATKLVENIFRAVNIALVNELKVVYDAMDVDIWEVLDAAATKPFGYMRFDPGPGWGGHCIPVDPFYLTWKAREHGVTTRFIELAGEVNRAMPGRVVERLQAALNQRGKAVHGSRVLVLGVAYKRDVDDTRESPALVVVPRLQALGARVDYHDPHVARLPPTREAPELAGMESVPLDAATLEAQDAVLVLTDHRAIDWAAVARHAPLVVDTRGVLRRLEGVEATVVGA